MYAYGDRGISLVLAVLLASGSAFAQAPPAAASAPAAASQPISQGLGVIVYPAKQQSSARQASDEHECHNWAQGQTGITPTAPPVAPGQPTQQTSGGGAASGAVKGAVAGVAIGAVAGDAGKGAAIGATAGLLTGGARKNRKQQEQQAQASQAQQAHASEVAAYNERMGTFKKAFGVCVQGRGYTVSN